MIELTILAALWAFSPIGRLAFILPKLLVLVAGVTAYALRRRPRVLAFLAVASLSTWRADFPIASLLGMPYEWATGLVSLAFLGLLTLVPTKRPWLRWAGIGIAVHCLAQFWGLDRVIHLGLLDEPHAPAWVGSHVDAGAMIAMALPVASSPLAVIVMLAGILATRSRGALLAAGVILLPRRWRLPVLVIMIAAPFLPLLSKAPKDKGRWEMSRVAVAGWRERPIIGHGPDSFRMTFDRLKQQAFLPFPAYEQNHAHNDLLEALHNGGLLGLIAYLALVWPLLEASASLTALFIVLKFNPVGFVVLSSAALIAANIYELDDDDGQGLEYY